MDAIDRNTGRMLQQGFTRERLAKLPGIRSVSASVACPARSDDMILPATTR
jgi:hypothetical protein